MDGFELDDYESLLPEQLVVVQTQPDNSNTILVYSLLKSGS